MFSNSTISFILELALPGVVLDDIEVKVEENFLTVTAKRTPVMFQDRATYLRKNFLQP
ncbi:MAG: Hsp20/alpha crystallin family protein [Candidatus Obscuribacter sp.]|nr:Hsp20/alpha crystallin family protein [Candidatus Obscuribacter sp.]